MDARVDGTFLAGDDKQRTLDRGRNGVREPRRAEMRGGVFAATGLIKIKVAASRRRYKTRQMNPICPKCNISMNLVREVPRVGAMPTLRTYRCACGYVFTEEEGFEERPVALKGL